MEIDHGERKPEPASIPRPNTKSEAKSRSKKRSRTPSQLLQKLPAAEGSLRSILLQHPRERLWVSPLKWTQRHLSLLSCNLIMNATKGEQSSEFKHTATTPWLTHARSALGRINTRNSFAYHSYCCTKLICDLSFHIQKESKNIHSGQVYPLMLSSSPSHDC